MKTLIEIVDEFYRSAQIEDSPRRSELFRTKYPTNDVTVVATTCVRYGRILYLGIETIDGRSFVRAVETAVDHPLDHLPVQNIVSLFRNVPGYTGQGWIEVEL